MKKLMILTLTCALFVNLCACGKAQQETPTDTTAATTATTATVATDATDPTKQTEPADNRKALAESCIDKPVAELYALIGQPNSSDYAPSCMGDGEDGNLYYDGFIVYTYKEGDSESVYFVE